MFVNMVSAEVQYRQEGDGSQQVASILLCDKDINGRLIATLFPVTDIHPPGSEHYCQICEITFAIYERKDGPSAGCTRIRPHLAIFHSIESMLSYVMGRTLLKFQAT